MSEETAYMFSKWLSDSVNIGVSEGLVRSILAEREVNEDSLYSDVDIRTRNLCMADLYSRIALTSPNREGAVSDSDNGWSHSDGGYTLSEYDKKQLLNTANAIYAMYNEPEKGRKVTVKITNYGLIRRRIEL